ncbi:MAG: PD40 domain-containing protein [Acidobacteria bacterium]|nr:PD40 domain-containing protein [Acidobacteriota bacterium]
MDCKKLLSLACALCFIAPVLRAQDNDIVLRPTPGEEIILAVTDIKPASEDYPAELEDAIETFNRVLWDDLSFSGFFRLAGKSFYPPQTGAIQSEVDIPYDAWGALPFRVSFLASGTLSLSDGILRADLHIFDMKQRRRSFGLNIPGVTEQIRAIAHQWADEIVYRLTAGASRGIASTKIAYTLKAGDAEEIFVMDYDGHNAQAFTQNGSTNLFPNWSQDNSKLAFLSMRTGRWEINIYSYLDGMRLPFPIFNTFVNTPAISPDGDRVVFAKRTPQGDTDLYISKLDGSQQRNVTNNPAIDSSPTWSPSGRQIAFASNRGGSASQIYICDEDGANVRRLVKEGGDADSPAWSPDGRWLAFHWKPRLRTYYDLFLAEVSSGRILQLTTESGSNEIPSWAPDGRHLVFQSNRTGTNQIYIMLLDEQAATRRITRSGENRGPAWGGYFRK